MSEEDQAYPKSASGKPVALEARDLSEDGRRFSPSTARNKDAVSEIVQGLVSGPVEVLEIASGTGEHGAHFTGVSPHIHWTYSDIDPQGRKSQAAWREHVGHERLSGPLTIDTRAPDWGLGERVWDAMFCANMIHIAPFEAALGLLSGAGRLLRPGGWLLCYGPFARNGQIAESNLRFSNDLKRRDENWGVRDLELEIMPAARDAGLELADITQMPANNLCVRFEKQPE